MKQASMVSGLIVTSLIINSKLIHCFKEKIINLYQLRHHVEIVARIITPVKGHSKYTITTTGYQKRLNPFCSSYFYEECIIYSPENPQRRD